MRILHISYYYLPHVGGGSWTTYHLSKRLASNGNHVNLVVPNVHHAMALSGNALEFPRQKNPAVICITPSFQLPRILAPLLSTPFLMFKGLQIGKDSDVILCQFHPHHLVAFVGFVLGRILHIPVVVRADDIYNRELWKENGNSSRLKRYYVEASNSFLEHLAKHVAVFLVVCSEQKEILESRLGQMENVQISHNGVDLSEFDEIRLDSRKSLGIEPNEKAILFVGRFSGPEYQVEVLLRAFEIVSRNLRDSLLILLGDNLTQKLQDGIVKNARIRVVGATSRSEIRKYLIASDLCIGPLGSTRTIPLKILEYMACGKPVITGVGSTSRDIGINGLNCILVPPEPTILAETILRILQNEEYGEVLGLNARKIASKFTWENVSAKLETILHDCAKSWQRESGVISVEVQ